MTDLLEGKKMEGLPCYLTILNADPTLLHLHRVDACVGRMQQGRAPANHSGATWSPSVPSLLLAILKMMHSGVVPRGDGVVGG